MKDKETNDRRVQTYSLREIRDALRDLSLGGHPDDYIPKNAKITLTKQNRIRLEWKV